MFRRTNPTPSIELSGFSTIEAYEARVPDWEPDEPFESLDVATAAARAWVAATGEAAQVEVLEVAGDLAQVRRLVTANGMEDVD